jgi:hypothetical protein
MPRGAFTVQASPVATTVHDSSISSRFIICHVAAPPFRPRRARRRRPGAARRPRRGPGRARERGAAARKGLSTARASATAAGRHSCPHSTGGTTLRACRGAEGAAVGFRRAPERAGSHVLPPSRRLPASGSPCYATGWSDFRWSGARARAARRRAALPTRRPRFLRRRPVPGHGREGEAAAAAAPLRGGRLVLLLFAASPADPEKATAPIAIGSVDWSAARRGDSARSLARSLEDGGAVPAAGPGGGSPASARPRGEAPAAPAAASGRAEAGRAPLVGAAAARAGEQGRFFAARLEGASSLSQPRPPAAGDGASPPAGVPSGGMEASL